MRRIKKQRKKPHGEWKVFWLAALITACPALFVTLIIFWSSHPDVYWATLVPREGDARFVPWRTLDDLTSEPVEPTSSHPDLFGPEVQVLGYMVPFPSSRDQGGVAARFLLVPDPGNWLHPPHFHAGEVIDVRLNGGKRVPLLEGRVVIVRGTMSFDPIKLEPWGEAMFHIVAASVAPLSE